MIEPRARMRSRGGRGSSPVETAAYWIARKDMQDLSAEDQVAFDRWLEESADNARAYRRVASALTLLDEPQSGPAELDAFRLAAHNARPSPWRARSATILGAVACLAVAGWSLAPHLTRPSEEPLQVATAQNLQRSYATGIGESAVYRLDDGSRVTLNSGTRLSVAFSSGRRSVRLDHGQAFFDVARDAARPFVVRVGSRQITAIGTAFEVLQSGGRLAITLEHGKIRIDQADIARTGADSFTPVRPGGVIMTPGHRLSVQAGAPDRLSSVNLAKVLAWRVGRVEFDNEALRDIVAEINRYSARPVVLTNERIGAMRLSGIMQTEAPDDFLRALPELLPVTVADADSPDRIEIREAAAK